MSAKSPGPGDGPPRDSRALRSREQVYGRSHVEPARLPMVEWGSLDVLQQAAVRSFLAPLFGRFSDKRDVIAALDPSPPRPSPPPSPSDDGNVWIDVVSDTGEGFDSTYTVARIVSQPTLEVGGAGGAERSTRRGTLLLFGGDEVYPYAEPGAYRDRFESPWSQALPAGASGKAPIERLAALPGNHDWYDGLGCFLETFRPGRRIGERCVDQRRSYWAQDLGRGWWAFSLDLQFTDAMDAPQIDYFQRVVESWGSESKNVLVLVPEPAWVYDDVEARTLATSKMTALERFEREVLRSTHPMRAVLTGDLHHYARYEERGAGDRVRAPDAGPGPRPGRPWITMGGGGAHLRGTHDLSATIRPVHTDRFGALERREVWPPASRTRARSLLAAMLPWFAPSLAILFGVLAVLFAWSLGDDLRLALASTVSTCVAVADFVGALAGHPLATLVTAGVLAALVAAADMKHPLGKAVVGLLHAAAHLVLLLGLTWCAARLADRSDVGTATIVGGAAVLAAGAAWRLLRRRRLEGAEPVARKSFLARFAPFLGAAALIWIALDGVAPLRWLALVGVLAAPAHSILVGIYLALMSAVFSRHVGPALACQGIADWKGFLRLRIAPDGALTIHSIGIPVVRKGKAWDWSVQSGRFEPADGGAIAEVVLVDEPLTLPATAEEAEGALLAGA